jgi:PAS domain-containing protein
MTHDTENTRALTGSSLLEALLQTSSDAIVMSDAEGRIVFWNPGAIRIEPRRDCRRQKFVSHAARG